VRAKRLPIQHAPVVDSLRAGNKTHLAGRSINQRAQNHSSLVFSRLRFALSYWGPVPPL